MTTRTIRRAALAALVLLVAVMGVLPLLKRGEEPLTVTADFMRTSGLYEDNDVTVLGVPVGRVTAVEPDGPIVRVTMELDPDVAIPANAGAMIMQRSLVTDRYVELTPAYASGERLADGAHLPVARTKSPTGTDDVLAAMNRLLDALDKSGKAGLAGLLSAGAKNLAGNGEAISRVVSGVRQLAQTGAASSEDLYSIVTGLDQLSLALTRRDALVNRFSTHLTEVTVQFARDRKTFASTIGELGTSMRFLADFLTTNQEELGADVRRISLLASAMRKHQAQLVTALRVTPQAYMNVSNSVNEKGQLYVFVNGIEFAKNPQVLSPLCQGALAVLCSPTSGAAPRTSTGVPLSLRSLLGGAR